MSQPSSAAQGKGKGKGRGRPSGAKTVNRTPGAARPGPVPCSKNNQTAPTRAIPFHARYAQGRELQQQTSSSRCDDVSTVSKTSEFSRGDGARNRWPPFERPRSRDVSLPRATAASGSEAGVVVPQPAVNESSDSEARSETVASPTSPLVPQGAPEVPEVAAAPAACVPSRELRGRFGPGADFIQRLNPQDRFAAIVISRVNARMKRKGHGSKHGVSGKLDGGSPWFYPDDPIEAAVPDRDTHLMRPIFLCVWEFLDKDIKAPSCPRCRSADNVVSDGWDPQRRTVFGEHFNYDLLGFQHKCTACRDTEGKGKAAATSSYKFSPWHPEVLRQLPRDLQVLFPAIIVRRNAVDKKIVRRIKQALMRGVGLKAVVDDIRENHLLHFHEMEARYYFRMARQGSFLPMENERSRIPPVLGRWDDPLGYDGRSPRETLLASVRSAVFEGQEQCYHGQQNHHRLIQVINFSAFADSWNQDVVAAEQEVLAGLQERGVAGDLINRKTAGHLQNYWTESGKDVNTKRKMERHNTVNRTLRPRLTVQSATREAAQEDGDDEPASFGMTQSGQTIISPSAATAQTAQAEPAPCASARGLLGAEAEEASRPGLDSGGGNFGGGCDDVEDDDGCEIDVGGGPVSEVPQERTWSTAAVGDVTFVSPVQVCRSYQPVAPRFGIGGPTADQQRVWNIPILPSGKSRPVKSTRNRPHRCQGCGHYKRAVPHPDPKKKGQKAVCNVPENERREPDFSNRVRNRYDTSKPCPCEVCTAYISRLPREI